ncbi:GCN5 family acetyltransferase [Curtobacterium sp. VKM Ac-1376]|uniref:GCN5 family acetyltransferase n=1 Tax=Curtobacterium sp. VKM Ac-1376 TaxID=123312 RepID=UPI00188A0228|nr:GCN5 family acetyltransferase [Curtobacterium sp. VKM Ac-1376]MBF4616420.1 GCN5 family acetyltransferase [Curtobacterium sp. VKM Ac-1376]
MNMRVRRVEALESFRSPFDMTVAGFNERWWGRARYSTEPNYETLTFDQDGVEVARAEIDTAAQIADVYKGFTPPASAIDVSFFEVREGYRLAGVGEAAMMLLVSRYPGRTFTAFSEQADGFWSGIGWTHYPRVDRSMHYRPLFVKHATPPLVRRSR